MTIAVQVITRAQASALRAQCEARPPGERWALIVDGLFAPLGDAVDVETHGLAGCACCVGNLALRVTLGRLIRRGGIARIVVVTAAQDHVEGVYKVIREAQFAPHLRMAGD